MLRAWREDQFPAYAGKFERDSAAENRRCRLRVFLLKLRKAEIAGARRVRDRDGRIGVLLLDVGETKKLALDLRPRSNRLRGSWFRMPVWPDMEEEE